MPPTWKESMRQPPTKLAAFALSAMSAGNDRLPSTPRGVVYIDLSYDVFSMLLEPEGPGHDDCSAGPGTVLGPVVGAWIFVILEEIIWRVPRIGSRHPRDRDRACSFLRAAGRAAAALGSRRGIAWRSWGRQRVP